jgi:hypothetical protein
MRGHPLSATWKRIGKLCEIVPCETSPVLIQIKYTTTVRKINNYLMFEEYQNHCTLKKQHLTCKRAWRLTRSLRLKFSFVDFENTMYIVVTNDDDSVVHTQPSILSNGILKPSERTTDHGQATGKLYHLRLRIEPYW